MGWAQATVLRAQGTPVDMEALVREARARQAAQLRRRMQHQPTSSRIPAAPSGAGSGPGAESPPPPPPAPPARSSRLPSAGSRLPAPRIPGLERAVAPSPEEARDRARNLAAPGPAGSAPAAVWAPGGAMAGSPRLTPGQAPAPMTAAGLPPELRARLNGAAVTAADEAEEARLRQETFGRPLTLAQAPPADAAARAAQARAAAAAARAARAGGAAPAGGAPAGGAGAVPRSPDGTPRYDPDELVTVDFKDADIKVILRFLAEKTQTNYYLDPTIAAKITVIGPNPIPLGRAIAFLEAAMESRGLTVVDGDEWKHVIPQAKAPSSDVPLYVEPPDLPATKLEQDRTVTEIMDLRYAPVEEVKTALGALVANQGALLTHPQTNKLIVTETLRNLERIKRVIAELDVPVVGKSVWLIPVQYRKAEELATKVGEILEKEELDKRLPPTKEQQATKPAVLHDPGQNSIVLVATRRDYERIRGLVAKLDQDPNAGPVVEFLKLVNAEPGQVVERINAAFQSSQVKGAALFTVVADDRTRSVLLRTSSPNLAERIKEVIAQLDQSGDDVEGARVRVYKLEFAEASKVAEILSQIAFQKGAGPRPAGAAAGAGAAAQDEIKIVADENSNSLVITSPRDVFPMIEAVIRELDVVKPQVMVEVLIAEVDYDWSKGIGLDFNFLNEISTNTNRPFAIGNADNLESLFTGGGLANGLSVGLLHGNNFDLTAAAGGDAGELSKISLLARFFENSAHANILSAPVLMTSDNETAKIQVGERIQLPASFTTAANTGLNSVTSFNTEDIGVILEVTPRITRNDHVILKVDQNISARTGDILGSLQTPVISKRQVTTAINILNKETVVIGGLLSEEENRSSTRIPGLSRIPLLGNLFRNRATSRKKTNLLVFLTPHIIRSEAEASYMTAKVAQDLKAEIDESQASTDSEIRKVFTGGRSFGHLGERAEVETPAASALGSTGPGEDLLNPRLQDMVQRLKQRYQGHSGGTGDGNVVDISEVANGTGSGGARPPGPRGTGGGAAAPGVVDVLEGTGAGTALPSVREGRGGG